MQRYLLLLVMLLTLVLTVIQLCYASDTAPIPPASNKDKYIVYAIDKHPQAVPKTIYSCAPTGCQELKAIAMHDCLTLKVLPEELPKCTAYLVAIRTNNYIPLRGKHQDRVVVSNPRPITQYPVIVCGPHNICAPVSGVHNPATLSNKRGIIKHLLY
jgi:hypothetical protein